MASTSSSPEPTSRTRNITSRPYGIPTLPDGPKGEYVTDRLTNEAIRFIDANKDKPFFLYLPHFAVHLPLQAKQKLIDKYQAKIKPGDAQANAIYAAMIDSLDQSVGRIRRELKKLGIADHTVVIFASDNGGRVPTTSNLPLRVGKGSCYEGGTRVPLIIVLARRHEARQRVRYARHQHGPVPNISWKSPAFPTAAKTAARRREPGAAAPGIR